MASRRRAARVFGARRRDIERQFLWEAIALATLGGILGVMVALYAVLGIWLMRWFTSTRCVFKRAAGSDVLATLLVLASFGAGYTWGATLIRWSI